jgi:flagellin-like hook-associated protein FlgL
VVDSTLTTQVNALVTSLDSALTTLRTKSQTIGSNVALLQTRLDFTANYVNTLQEGSDKLVLADLNEEGANLLALQTRQQLGISALSFAGQAEQSILALSFAGQAEQSILALFR